MMEVNDTVLVRQTLKGDAAAFEALVDKYQKIIFNLTLRLTRDFDDAEDVTQMVFIKAFEKLDTYKPRYKFYSWLYRIAVNEALNFVKKKKHSDELDDHLISKSKNPEQAYTETELSQQVQNMLMRLEPPHRILIILKHFMNCTYKEIADILDIPEKKVKSRLYTARQLLKDFFIKEGSI